jgi:ribosomal protein S18 acetylase RimI-like enzyme
MRRFENPAQDDGLYRFVHACPGSTATDIANLRSSERQITRRTFQQKLGPEQWAWIQAELGYDRHFPISKADWQIPYFKATYRGVPAVFLIWSGFEYIFTLNGELGASADPGFVNTDWRARPGKPGRFELNPPISFSNWHMGGQWDREDYTLFALTPEGHEELQRGILDHPTRDMTLGLVDYSVLEPRPGFGREGRQVAIKFVAVGPEHRRQGVGTALWRELERLYPDATFPVHSGLTPPGAALRRSVGHNPLRRNHDESRRRLERTVRGQGGHVAREALAREEARAGVKRTMSGKILGQWEETDEESYDWGLNAVPPARMWGSGHVVGERYSSTPAGETVWTVYEKHGGRYWRTLSTFSDLQGHLRELRARPLPNPRLYHRGPRKVDEFDPGRMRFGDYGPGFYFSEQPTQDHVYGQWLHEADVDVSKPLNLEASDSKQISRVLRALRIRPDDLFEGEPPLVQAMGLAQTAVEAGVYRMDAVINVLEKLGYDGIVVPSKGYWSAFRPSQIKVTSAARRNPSDYEDLASGDLFGHRGGTPRQMGQFKVGQRVWWKESGHEAGVIYKLLPYGYGSQMIGPSPKLRGALVERPPGRFTPIALMLLTPHRPGLHHGRLLKNPDADLERLVRRATRELDPHLILQAANQAVRERRPDVLSRDGGLIDAAIEIEDTHIDLPPGPLVGKLANLYWHARGAFSKNPDLDLRQLERRARAGDPQAVLILEARQARLRPGPLITRANEILEVLKAQPLEWHELMLELVDVCREHFGLNYEAMRKYLLDPGHAGLDWVYRTHLTYGVEGLYQGAWQEALDDADLSVGDYNGSNELLTVPMRGSRDYELQIDVYLSVPDEDSLEAFSTSMSRNLESRDEDLASEHAPGMERDHYWDADAHYEELEGAEILDATAYNKIPFDLYHLFALLGTKVSFEGPPRPRRKKKAIRRKKKKRRKKV